LGFLGSRKVTKAKNCFLENNQKMISAEVRESTKEKGKYKPIVRVVKRKLLKVLNNTVLNKKG